jgi:hypothetical protein
MIHITSIVKVVSEIKISTRSVGRHPAEHILPLTRIGGLLSVQALAGEEVRMIIQKGKQRLEKSWLRPQ